VGLLTYFIDQIADPAEKNRAWQRYHQVVDFVERGKCRHLQICSHFGESPKWITCGACDVCGAEPEWLSAFDARSSKSTRAYGGRAGTGQTFRPVKKSSQPGVDPELSEYLREWRRTTAREQGIAAFVVMHDTTLEEVCRTNPRSLSEVRRIPGFGERRTELYGQAILNALQRFRDGARASEALKKKSKPAEETMNLLAEGHTLEEIAKIRGRQIGSVANIVAEMLEQGQLEFQPSWVGADNLEKIQSACSRLGMERLRTLKDDLPPEITFEEIRLVVAMLRTRQGQA
jgi:ATP-dependent DNA helicase RecQ